MNETKLELIQKHKRLVDEIVDLRAKQRAMFMQEKSVYAKMQQIEKKMKMLKEPTKERARKIVLAEVTD